MKYLVDCTVIYNGTIAVEADNFDDALNIASEELNYKNLSGFPDLVEVGDATFSFGEATADYAYQE